MLESEGLQHSEVQSEPKLDDGPESATCRGQPHESVESENINKLSLKEMKEVENDLGITLSQGKGVPMFLRCESIVKDKSIGIDLEIDSGADRCVITKKEALRLGVKFQPFKSPKAISGLGAESVICKHFCILRIKIFDRDKNIMHLNLLFYIFDGSMPNLLGSDCINYMNGQIDYKDKILTLNNSIFQLFLEERSFNDNKEIKRGTSFFFTTDTCIPPKTCRKYLVRTDGPVGSGKSAFIGDYNGELVVVDTAYDGEKANYWIVVMNIKPEPIKINRDERLGYILKEENDNSIYSVDELLSDPIYFNQDNRDRDMQYHNGRDNDSSKGNSHIESGSLETLVIPDCRKMTAGNLDRFYDEGVPIPNPRKCEIVEPMKGDEIIDKQKELKKNSKSDMWVDKELFFSNFLWNKMREEIDGEIGVEGGAVFENKLKDLFWNYKGVFWNGDWSKWGRAKIPDLEIEIEEGTSAIDKYRKMSDEKEALLRAYMSDLLKAGVIEPSTGNSSYVANPHVIFSRVHATL